MVLEKIEKLIQYNKEDNVLNHFKTFLFIGNTGYCGIVKENEFRIWRYSYWIGIGYPVIIGIISKENGKEKVKIRAKLNSLAQFFRFLMLVIIGHLIFDVFMHEPKIEAFYLVSSTFLIMYIYLYFGYLYVINLTNIKRNKIMQHI